MNRVYGNLFVDAKSALFGFPPTGCQLIPLSGDHIIS